MIRIYMGEVSGFAVPPPMVWSAGKIQKSYRIVQMALGVFKKALAAFKKALVAFKNALVAL